MASIEWETPQTFFDALDAEFGFTLDVCASDSNAKLPNHYTIRDNALLKEWRGVIWLNPPYNGDIDKWVGRAWGAAQEGQTVVALLQARSGDTKWFHLYVMRASEIRFVKDRLHFALDGKAARANISSMIVVFRPYCKGPPTISSIDTIGRKLYG